MSINTIAYAHDKKGKLAVFRIEAESFQDAIDDIKTELGAERAMCLVISQPAAVAAPADQEAA